MTWFSQFDFGKLIEIEIKFFEVRWNLLDASDIVFWEVEDTKIAEVHCSAIDLRKALAYKCELFIMVVYEFIVADESRHAILKY